MLERDTEIFRSSLKKRLSAQNTNSQIVDNNENTLQEDDLNEFDIELAELSFKPLTSGLGFHQKPTLSKNAIIAKRMVSPPTSPISIQNSALQSRTTIRPNVSLDKKVDQTVSLTSQERAVLNRVKMNQAQIIDAPKSAQILAWIFDLICISFLLFITAWAFVRTSGVPAYQFLQVVDPKDVIFFMGGLFITYYILYFSILDLSVTPGKSLFDLKLVRTDGKDLRLTQSFLRSLVGLFSICLAGIPLLFNLQGALSQTKITRIK